MLATAKYVPTLREPVLKHLANGTPETVGLSEVFQRPHVVSKRLFPLASGNDIVSRNITMVLENLLKNYESSQLPTHGKGSVQNGVSSFMRFVTLIQEVLGSNTGLDMYRLMSRPRPVPFSSFIIRQYICFIIPFYLQSVPVHSANRVKTYKTGCRRALSRAPL
jgi:hypothetical protein